ncbi:MAG: hypothetical protein HY271_20875 [Deltaproteobacteria bacterium]|nr:hypothetical protein [Deltaproteobacteria bacterium]
MAKPFESDRGTSSRPRSAVFLDVRTSWRLDGSARVLEQLAPRVVRGDIELLAVADWVAVGPEMARLFASHGARLIAGAPDPSSGSRRGVSLAVIAGLWLASCDAGAVLEIITDGADDHTFDAVGYAAARRGAVFRRLSLREIRG